MSEMLDPAKLKVAELRAELQARGLDAKGNKPVLVERLREALEAEAQDGGGNESMGGGGAAVEEQEQEQEQEEEEEEDMPQEEEPVEELQEEEEQEENTAASRSPSKLPASSPTKEPVKDEPESLKTGYEEGPVEDVEVKQEPGNGMDPTTEVKVEAEVKEEEVEVKQEQQQEETQKRGEKRARSGSPAVVPEPKKARPDVEEVRVEDEPEFDKTAVILDWYNSDLSVVINKEDYLSAQPLTMQGFGYVWHGIRATYGFTHGRVCFEVRVEEYLPVPQLEEEEQHPHVLRVGWSVGDAGLTLGEDPLSYGYGGTGKASTNLRFKDYGKQFGKGDVLGCFLDLEVEPIVMTFTLNGENLGIAYEVTHAELGDSALFPHIVTKNASFRVNFGTEDAWMPALTGYTFVGNVALEERVLGPQGPEKREDAEVIMMVGLPASGKTTWVDEYCKTNLDRKYNILGTNSLIDKMKVNGLPRRRNYSGRWEVLIERCTKCLNKLLELSYKRRRNFIIDQTNVYPSAQRRKMKGFAGFKRRAVVICPTDEDLKKRTEKREKEEGKDVPDKAVLEMKANFKLPEEGELFDSVEFVELQREEAQKLVEQYNKEGEEAGFGQKKGFRGGFNDRRGGFMDRRGGYGNRGGNYNRGGWDRDRRGGYNDRRDRGGWNRDRENRDYNSGGGGRGSFNREGRGGYGGYNREGRGGYNRGNSYNRENRGGNRSGSYQSGNWNRNSGNETQGSTSSNGYNTNPWATQQGSQGGQGYGGYNSYPGQQGAWGSQGYNYGQGSYANQWGQQYYQQPQQAQQQQYWGTGYGYQGYGQGQQYTSATAGQAQGTWGQQGSWGTGQQQWGGYGKQQWGGNQSYNSTNQRR